MSEAKRRQEKAYWKAKTAEREKPLRGFLTREATIWQYTDGVRDSARSL